MKAGKKSLRYYEAYNFIQIRWCFFLNNNINYNSKTTSFYKLPQTNRGVLNKCKVFISFCK